MPNPVNVIALPAEVFAHPDALFAKLGDREPVHRVTLPDGMPSVLVTGNAAARAALSDQRLVRSVSAAAAELHKYHPLASSDYPLSKHMLVADGEDHVRMRGLVAKAFNPQAGRADATAHPADHRRPDRRHRGRRVGRPGAGAGAAAHGDQRDAGHPVRRPRRVRRHAETLTGINASSGFDDIIKAGDWFNQYLTALVDGRRGEPGDDLVSALIQAQEQDDRLTDMEIRSNALLLPRVALRYAIEHLDKATRSRYLAMKGRPSRTTCGGTRTGVS